MENEIKEEFDTIGEAINFLNSTLMEYEEKENIKITYHSVDNNDNGKYVVTIKYKELDRTR